MGMRTDRVQRARTTLLTVTCLAWVALLLGSTHVYAHGPEENRQVLVSVEAETLDLLVGWELTPGAETQRYRALVDLDRSGSLDGPLERWLAQSYLLPRLMGGLVIEVDGRRATPEIVHAVFRDGPGRGDGRPLVGMAHLRIRWPADSAWLRLRLGLELDQAPATVALQVVAPNITVEETNLRISETPGLWNPMWIQEQEALEVLLRRREPNPETSREHELR